MIDTASELESIARHLRFAGQVDLVKSLQRAVTDAASPVKDDIRSALSDYMPKRYAATLGADLKLGTSSRLSGGNPGVSVWGRGGVRGRKLRRLDAGILTHPVFGDRSRWIDQTDGMTRGFFTGPAEKAAPRVREAIIAALNDVSERAVRKGP